jgi:hypothetical protein
MKTSNKLLAGFFLAILLSTVTFITAAKLYANKDWVKTKGVSKTETRETGSFNKIHASHSIHVTIAQGQTSKVEVKADENLLPEIITEVKNQTLTIKKNNKIKREEKIEVFVTLPELTELVLSNGTHVTSPGEISGQDLKLEVSSGSHNTLYLNYENLTIENSSGAHSNLKGKATTASLTASSGAHINAQDLVVDKGSCNVSSGAHVNIKITNQINASASTGGHLNYIGNPAIKQVNTSTGGHINQVSNN